MKKFIFTVGIIVLMIGMNACKSKESTKSESSLAALATSDNSQNALNWEGTYAGIVPCANCQGIFTQITLRRNSTYTIQTEYLGKEESSAETYTGTFEWDASGSVITLNGMAEQSGPSHYKVGENILFQLDMDGNVITGELAANYTLAKINEDLLEKKWKLYEINGVLVSTMESPTAKNAFITFHAKENRVSGNSGCNNFSGVYQFGPGDRLQFSTMVSTRKMCIDMSVEDQMNKLFQAVDSYTLLNDTLSFNRARMAPLARFIPE